MIPDIKKYFIKENISLKQALHNLEKNSQKCLIIVDSKLRLKGSLTDGDIRRAILKGGSFNSKIKSFYNKKPKSINVKDRKSNKISKIINEIKDEYKIIPIINSKRQIVDLLTKKNKRISDYRDNYKLKNICAVIMAGGEGTRLHPFTKILPKPLVPINGKAMAEHIISRFKKYGVNKFFLSLNYKSNLIKAYFSDHKLYNLKFINERKPLGTAGSLKNMSNKTKKSFFVVNCDTIINCDYISLYDFHNTKKFDLTIVASKKNHSIPYGVCQLDMRGKLKILKEKPTQSFLANTGFYIINPKILKYIKKNEKLDMNNLIDRLIRKKLKVGVFPIDENDWFDFGQKEGFKITNNQF